jgi:hypothetical protein
MMKSIYPDFTNRSFQGGQMDEVKTAVTVVVDFYNNERPQLEDNRIHARILCGCVLTEYFIPQNILSIFLFNLHIVLKIVVLRSK